MLHKLLFQIKRKEKREVASGLTLEDTQMRKHELVFAAMFADQKRNGVLLH